MNEYKRVFLVDTLNINDYSFMELIKLDSNDIIYLFKTDSSKKLNLNEMECLMKSKCKIKYVNLNTNIFTNMSMYICFYLGKLCVNLQVTSEVFIVSNTTNFESLIELVDVDFKLIHLTNESLKDLSYDCSDDEEVSIFPAYNSVKEVFNNTHPSENKSSDFSDELKDDEGNLPDVEVALEIIKHN